MSDDSISSPGDTQVGGNQVGASVAAAGYAGDVSVQDTWAMLRDVDSAVLVDVRTPAEWNYVGITDLSALGKEPLHIAWLDFPGMALNAEFVDQIKRQDLPGEAAILLLCRSGVRSKAAAIALTAAGFGACYNIAGGFEGDADDQKHRGVTGGWKAAGLSWVQS